MNTADYVYFCTDSGRAVVLLKAHTLYVLRVKDDSTIEGPNTPPEDFRIQDWFQFSESKLVDIDVGTYPFKPLQKYMILKCNAQKLVSLFDHVLNRKHPFSFRRRAALRFEILYAKAPSAVTEEFLRIKTFTPTPINTSTDDMPFCEDGVAKDIWSKILARSRT